MRGILKSRKGDLVDLFVFIIVAFVMVVVFALFIYAGDVTRDQLQANSDVFQNILPEDKNASQIIDATYGAVPSSYDALSWISVAIIVTMVISMLITSFLIRTHPVIIVPYILVWIVAIVFSVYVSNAYEVLYEDATLGSSFVGPSSVILLNLHIWVMVIGAIAGVLMVANMIRGERYG